MAAPKDVNKWLGALLKKQRHLQACLEFIEQDRKMSGHEKSKKLLSHKLLAQRVLSTEKLFRNLQTLGSAQETQLESAFSSYSKLVQSLEDFISPVFKDPEFKIFKFFSDPRNSSFPAPVPVTQPVLAEEPITAKSLCVELKKIATQLRAHSHSGYSEQLKRLENSTCKLKAKSIYIQQEASDQLKQVKSYLTRLKSLEPLYPNLNS